MQSSSCRKEIAYLLILLLHPINLTMLKNYEELKMILEGTNKIRIVVRDVGIANRRLFQKIYLNTNKNF